MKPRFLGLDLAWTPNHRSGLAALDGDGRLLDVNPDLKSDDEILAWIEEFRGDRGAIAIDMPTIVENPTGQRRCETLLRVDFHKHDAGPYPSNLGLPPFRDGGRAAAILRRIEGVTHTTEVEPLDDRTVAFEVYPHAAAVKLFGLDKTFKYKKKRRPWLDVLAAWSEYRAALASLERADPPLVIDPAKLPERVTSVRYKRMDDSINAVLCAYVAAYVWRHGSVEPRTKVYGDMTWGHIVTPWDRPG